MRGHETGFSKHFLLPVSCTSLLVDTCECNIQFSGPIVFKNITHPSSTVLMYGPTRALPRGPMCVLNVWWLIFTLEHAFLLLKVNCIESANKNMLNSTNCVYFNSLPYLNRLERNGWGPSAILCPGAQMLLRQPCINIVEMILFTWKE